MQKIFRRKLKLKKAIKYLLLLFNFLVILALILSYISVYIPPDRFWLPSFFGLAFPFIVLANIGFVIFWGIVKPRFMLFSLVAIVLGLGFINRYVQIGSRKTEKEGIKVVSYNVQNFTGKKVSDQKERASRIVDFLRSQNPDIICLQDVLLSDSRIFSLKKTVSNLESIEYYHFARTGGSFGQVTFTRYPIVKKGEIRYKKSPNMAIYTDVLIGSDTVRIFNVHLQSYRIDPRKYNIIDSPGIDDEKDLREIREIGGKLKKAFQMRAEQVREIRKLIDKTRYPIILCGDFNDTPVSYTYQNMRGDFDDAFVSSGRGLARTYIGKLPSFRIDNILHSDYFKSYNFRANNFKESDHLPVSCLLIRK